MREYKSPQSLPSAEELPDSNEAHIDNELQELMPGLLKAVLLTHWSERMDWFFGINMGIYYDPDEPPIVPNSFLSLGIERFYDEELRPSYALWDENVPILALEIVSTTYRKEYCAKKDEYESLGVLYYIVYSQWRRHKPRLEVCKLVNGKYVLQQDNPVWMPEIGLGIGCERGIYAGIGREWLYWYDENSKRYPTPQEQIKIAEQQAQAEAQRAEKLAAKLRELNIDPSGI
ncbi:hypothetical protein NIES4071_36640 [Calothrix sp. NIES-4071]|nr:hypothetical protein NIES4071_36640 [Calothrix sp. NIES-4071]BAZ57983.1 hypothetical protein NIES4105_36570 [Calothrix sp. NIES-4105]